ncbi:pyridoxal-dependent decarboxylase [Aliiroseovarius sp. KMU-50]|uniref:Pyridoxal-dependent decarboxylase n=1 Tax=Aliiroseovarius salicola TaxID=3009082 RepID=A0ABT4VYP8_9RHOB|nr:pyridoxal-dependent decarboxylase [Aliiroseovarius sp. KMU-50]MDA5093336.1 pyridoxal-dependent decarboxylase [Aliiroseovarius sp. KMU-50]
MTSNLDPKDWAAFRSQAHNLLDRCITQIAEAQQHPWQSPPEDAAERYAIGRHQSEGNELSARIDEDVLPYHGGNTHPRFWGWVQGTGLASDLIAGMVGATINTNGGGRNHGANEMERAVIDWTRVKMGFPEGASGIMVAGTSQATVIALQCARLRAQGTVRSEGTQAGFTCYAADGVHNATRKAIELLGIGHNALRLIPSSDGQMGASALREQIRKDRANGLCPMAIVGTAGSVDLGGFDDLNALADIASEENVWLHVDGAFGAWTRIADAPWRSLSDGIERADSIALDFHKWMYVNYDCGLALIRDEAEHRAAFAARPAYLQGADQGLAGGDPWFCDYGIDLSRGNRALKVWCALEMFGEEAFSEAITRNCELARLMGQEVISRGMALLSPVTSNICVFSADPDQTPEAQSALNSKIALDLQLSGEAVFSTTDVNGITCLRAAIVNHRSTKEDVIAALDAVVQAKGSTG